MFNRLCPPNFGRKKLAIFAKNIAQGKNVTQKFGNRWESSNMQATVFVPIGQTPLPPDLERPF